MKKLSYFILQNDISNGEEPILAKTSFRCQDSDFDDQYEAAIKQAYNGDVTVEDIPDEPQEPTQLDRVEAQVTYTAMMTDTLLEV